MAAHGEAASAADSRAVKARHRGAVLSPELIAIVAVGVTLAGVMLTMTTTMTESFARELGAVRDEVRVIRDGQIELRERMVRVEAKVDVLAGDWPPARNAGPAG